MNNEYRQYLIKNTNSIMQNNCNQVQTQNYIKNHSQSKIQMEITISYPYLFNGIHDDKRPYGYETSYPKELYLSQQQIDNQKRIPLQNDIR
jgi:hypothetical protein